MKRKQREKSSVTSSSQWSTLSKDLVVTISERLNLYMDYVRFRSVCKSWYSFLPKKSYHPSHNFPLLILHYYVKRDNHRNGIFGLAKNNKLVFLRDLPDKFLRNYVCMGSSHGNWLLMLKYSNRPIYLYNPFTKAKLTFPAIGHLSFLQKVVLSSTPTVAAVASHFPHLIVAVALHGNDGKLFFARLGDKAWTGLKPESDEFSDFKDVLFHGNKLYAVQGTSLKVYVFHMGPDMQIDSSSCSILQPQLELIDEYLKSYYMSLDKYSIELYLAKSSSNDVLMVVRVIECNETLPQRKTYYFMTEFKRKTVRFMVFKWETERWMHVKSLSEDILFVGPFSSFSISSRDFPDDCRGNYIYLIDVYRAFPENAIATNYDKGIFRLKDDDFIEESSLLLEVEDSWVIDCCHPPVWLTYIQPEAPNDVLPSESLTNSKADFEESDLQWI